MNNSKLIIGISSRALFNLDESHKIFEKDGLEAYGKYQIKNEDKVLEPGSAFSLVQKILKINDLYEEKNRIEVILLSRNITTKIYRLITLENTEEDFEATQDLFKINEEGFGQNEEDEDLGVDEENKEEKENEDKSKTKVTHIIVPPIFKGLKKY